MKAATLWPLAIVAVLAVTVALNIFVLIKAHDGNGAATEPDYYNKAVAWDSTMAVSRHDVQLGWRIDAGLSAVGRSPGLVTARLVDAAGAPLADAHVQLEAVNNLEAAHYLHAELVAVAPGTYVSPRLLDRAGLWELRFTVHRGGETFTQTVRGSAPRDAQP